MVSWLLIQKVLFERFSLAFVYTYWETLLSTVRKPGRIRRWMVSLGLSCESRSKALEISSKTRRVFLLLLNEADQWCETRTSWPPVNWRHRNPYRRPLSNLSHSSNKLSLSETVVLTTFGKKGGWRIVIAVRVKRMATFRNRGESQRFHWVGKTEEVRRKKNQIRGHFRGDAWNTVRFGHVQRTQCFRNLSNANIRLREGRGWECRSFNSSQLDYCRQFVVCVGMRPLISAPLRPKMSSTGLIPVTPKCEFKGYCSNCWF